MPDLDGFQLAAMIREHPRYQKTAMIFISAIHLSDMDRLRGYEMGAVDYVPVPVIPEVLRAKVRIFAELYRKTRELERLNEDLERRVAERTVELESSNAQLLKSEQRRSLALAAGNMGSWNWERASNEFSWDEGQYQIFGLDPHDFKPTPETFRSLIHPEDWDKVAPSFTRLMEKGEPFQAEFRIRRPDEQICWCVSSAAATLNAADEVVRISGVMTNITERKRAEERQSLLASEVDHRARNALAIVQSIIRLTKGDNIQSYTAAIEGRIKALSLAHSLLSQSRWTGADLDRLLSEELSPYKLGPDKIHVDGPEIHLAPAAAQTLALTLHEMATNAAKYGALSTASGSLDVDWTIEKGDLVLKWVEKGMPMPKKPPVDGLGTRIVKQSIEAQLGGRVKTEWRTEGLRCTLRVPLAKVMQTGSARQREPAPGALNGRKIEGNRLLIVEDESLVAMELGECLSALGFEVVGSVSTLAAAKEIAVKKDFDGAILDINLAGELVYPVADILMERKKPFVFVTGYRPEAVEPRFKDIAILQKPIDRATLAGLFQAAAATKFAPA
jgi:PAS domain S-box-containing protein